MRDVELYAQFLGLGDGWFASDIAIKIDALEVHVYLNYLPDAVMVCPKWNLSGPVYDRSPERVWRGLDTHRCTTLIHARLPRLSCPKHGVQTAKIPWSDTHARYTRLFESSVIRLLGLTKCQVRTARFMSLTERQVHTIMQRAVSRGLGRRKDISIKKLGIDEKSFHRGHVYASVLSDLGGKRVLDVQEGRTLESSCELISSGVAFSLDVECVSMDMCYAFARAVRKTLPRADIVLDRFHIAKYLNEAVDLTRRSEHGKLLRQGNWTLESSRYLWMKNRENHTPKQADRFKNLVHADLETAKAWALKESFKGFVQSDSPEDAERFLNDWVCEVQISKNRSLGKVAKMLMAHQEGLLAYVKHRVTNAAAESVNSMTLEIKTIARGFRRFANLKIAILFFVDKLELNP